MSTAYAAQPAAAFAVVSAIDHVSSGRFDAEVSPDWTIGGKPTGSYLLSVLGRAAVSTSGQPHVNAASARFALRAWGPEVVCRGGASGRSTSQLRARLAKVGTVGAAPDQRSGRRERRASGPRAVSPTSTAYQDCVRLEPRAPNGMQVTIMEQIEVRLEPSSRGSEERLDDR